MSISSNPPSPHQGRGSASLAKRSLYPPTLTATAQMLLCKSLQAANNSLMRADRLIPQGYLRGHCTATTAQTYPCSAPGRSINGISSRAAHAKQPARRCAISNSSTADGCVKYSKLNRPALPSRQERGRETNSRDSVDRSTEHGRRGRHKAFGGAEVIDSSSREKSLSSSTAASVGARSPHAGSRSRSATRLGSNRNSPYKSLRHDLSRGKVGCICDLGPVRLSSECAR